MTIKPIFSRVKIRILNTVRYVYGYLPQKLTDMGVGVDTLVPTPSHTHIIYIYIL
jgi:hypothetical protein